MTVFSVVIPVFNARRTLGRAVRSVLEQSFQDFELVVVDDGSTDGGIAALSEPLDPRVVVVRQENAGEGAARNRGIAVASHEWIAFLDADDLWFPEHLAELDRVRQRFPDAGLIGTRYVDSDFAGRYDVPPPADPTIALVRYFEEVGRRPLPLCASTAAVRRSAVDRVGGFADHALGADSELFARLALSGPVATSTRRTAVYVHGTGGAMESARARWKGARPASAADIAPAVATVLEHVAATGTSPSGLDDYVDRYVGWCLRASVQIADVETIRSLRRLYRLRPGPADRLLLTVGRLPPSLASAVRRPASRLARAIERAGVRRGRRRQGVA